MIAGDVGIALTINVTEVAVLSQPDPFISVTNKVTVFAVALLKPNAALVGLVPVVSGVVKATSLYHV
ncbi:MAG TPA: hypothetical protein DHV26_17285 [Cytophagales bacterium]|nr:hypothetical protein [Cytophagales bacterium]